MVFIGLCFLAAMDSAARQLRLNSPKPRRARNRSAPIRTASMSRRTGWTAGTACRSRSPDTGATPTRDAKANSISSLHPLAGLNHLPQRPLTLTDGRYLPPFALASTGATLNHPSDDQSDKEDSAMCYNCGCGMPNNDMGRPENITNKTSDGAAKAMGQSVKDAKAEALKLLEKVLATPQESNDKNWRP